MPAPASTSTPLLLCGIGLLLTVVEIPGFGFDFADDTLGLGLVCAGAARFPTTGGRPWALLTVVAAGCGALVSLFAYGGPAGLVVPRAHRLWDTAFYLDTLTTAAVVVGLLMLIRGRTMATTDGLRAVRKLPMVLGAYIVAAALMALLFGNEAAYVGVLGGVRQAAGVIVGGVHVAAAVVVLLASRGQ
jgi:hypothetical protein